MAVARRAILCAALVCLTSPGQASKPRSPALAYLAIADGYWEVWVADADGARTRQVTRSQVDKTRLSWYPEGDALFVSSNDGTVHKVDLEGRQTRIALEHASVVDAVLSPDGLRIAYSFSGAHDGNDIWIANGDGTSPQKIVRMAQFQHEPAWSADGERLYFLSGQGGQTHDIWRVSLVTRGVEQVTAGALYHFDVTVSSSGAIAFSSNRTGNYEIFVQRPGEEPEQLTDDPALDGKPTFSPDGKALIFESTRGGALNLWRIDLATRSLKQITRHKEGARSAAWYQGSRS